MRPILVVLVAVGCHGAAAPVADAPLHFDPATSGCDPTMDPGASLSADLFAYDWACTGAVPPTEVVPTASPDQVCPAGTWPDLAASSICPTISDVTRFDPASDMTLPPADPRTLPLELIPQEAGSFIAAPQASYPARFKVVSWNLAQTKQFDLQLQLLTTHPMLADADVYLLTEVDRCSNRNGGRRAARLLAQAIGGDYVAGVEFIELSIGRTVGGDTGQAIVSRRPLTGTTLECLPEASDWFASDTEPRLGQRVRLAADVAAGGAMVRVNAVHFESADVLGEKRVVQVRAVLDDLQRESCDRPTIVAGDFNTWYCSAPELEVLRRSGFTDATRTAGDLGPTEDNGLRLDYVWGRHVRVVDAGVVRGLAASDHDPVWAILEAD